MPFFGDSLWLSYGFTYFKVMLSVFKQVYSGVNNSGLKNSLCLAFMENLDKMKLEDIFEGLD